MMNNIYGRQWLKGLTGLSALALGACATTGEPAAPVAGGAETAGPSAPVYKAEDFLGAAAGELDARLGAPALTRREGEGEYRRYRLRTCSLIVILYPDDKGARRAAHLDATALSSDEEKPDLADCLAAG